MMRITVPIVVFGFVLLSAIMTPVGVANNVELRGMLANLGSAEYTWNSASFPGFYYDIDTNLGTEQLTFRLSNVDSSGAVAALSDQPDALGERGVSYTTMAQAKNFKFKPWGQYQVIGFLADRYFAAYSSVVTQGMESANENMPFLFDRSKNRNLMTNEQLTKILIDDNSEISIDSSSPLALKEGYELKLKSVNENETKTILQLKKDGNLVDTQIISPGVEGARLADKTYYYKKDIGETKEIVIIAVHVKNVFHAANDSATIDGIFQISDTPMPIKAEQQYGKMSIRTVDATALTITMDNKDNQIVLGKGLDIPLMGKIRIKTADQSSISSDNPLRYYIYSEEPCEC
jgi:S-layer protein (TIGR01567 family)